MHKQTSWTDIVEHYIRYTVWLLTWGVWNMHLFECLWDIWLNSETGYHYHMTILWNVEDFQIITFYFVVDGRHFWLTQQLYHCRSTLLMFLSLPSALSFLERECVCVCAKNEFSASGWLLIYLTFDPMTPGQRWDKALEIHSHRMHLLSRRSWHNDKTSQPTKQRNKREFERDRMPVDHLWAKTKGSKL